MVYTISLGKQGSKVFRHRFGKKAILASQAAWYRMENGRNLKMGKIGKKKGLGPK